MSEIQKFFEDLPGEDKREADVFNEKPEEKPAPVEGEETVPEKEEDEDSKEVRKNRRERRLEDKLRRKDEMLIALNERVIELSEQQKLAQEFKPTDDVPAEWIALYGDTPEAKRAWQLNQSLIHRAKEEGKQEAIQEFESKQQRQIEEQKKFENHIDSELESIEDDFDVDLTSNTPAARKARREFLEMVQELSPKDEEGNIISYADFGKTFEVYQRTRQKEKTPEVVNKQKELASRGINRAPSAGANDAPEGPINFKTARQAIGRMLGN